MSVKGQGSSGLLRDQGPGNTGEKQCMETERAVAPTPLKPHAPTRCSRWLLGNVCLIVLARTQTMHNKGAPVHSVAVRELARGYTEEWELHSSTTVLGGNRGEKWQRERQTGLRLRPLKICRPTQGSGPGQPPRQMTAVSAWQLGSYGTLDRNRTWGKKNRTMARRALHGVAP
jgi:hypothetical protein